MMSESPVSGGSRVTPARTLALVGIVLGISCSLKPQASEPTTLKTASTPTVAVRAKASPLKVEVPKESHSVEDPVLAWYDYNVYPADNAIILQGAAKGPIGDHTHATVWLTGVHSYEHDNGPSHLEAVIVYEVDCDDCPGDETTTAIISSAKATATKPASLLSVSSMTIADVDKDGQFEVVAEAEFLPCCVGDAQRKPYGERIVLDVQGPRITRSRK